MNRVVCIRRTVGTLLLILLPCFPFAGCSGARKIELPSGMTAFRDAKAKMEFRLPPGWEKADVDPAIDRITKPIRHGDAVGFRKGDKGWVAVWCDDFSPYRDSIWHMIDVLNEYAPVHELARVHYKVESPVSDFLAKYEVYAFPAIHVEKGERTEFSVVYARKDIAPSRREAWCEYMLFGRSASNEFSDEILRDISAVTATLAHP